VTLTEKEREQLLSLTSKGQVGARVMKRAQILLKADEGMKDADIVSTLNTSRPTVERIRKRFVQGNLEKALYDDPRPGSKTRLDGRGEAELIALTCSEAPDGHEKWSLRLLADKLVEMNVVDGISHETVRQTLKKMI
jgi:hypothetical protein